MNDKYKPKNIFRRYLCIIFTFIPLYLLFFSCIRDETGTGDTIERMPVLVEEYPELYETLTGRKSDEILQFVSSSSREVRNYAWAALYHSDIMIDREILELIRTADDEAGWMMIGYHEVDKAILQQVLEWWVNDEVNRSHACMALGEIGGLQTLETLLEYQEVVTGDQNCALAAGRIISTHDIPGGLKAEAAQLAFETNDQAIQQRLLYGFYRNASSRPEPGTTAYDTLFQGWINSGLKNNSALDQYMARILGEEAFIAVMESYNDAGLNENLHLAIELARESRFLNDPLEEHIIRLLKHDSPHVVSQTLQAMERDTPYANEILAFAEREFTGSETDSEIYIETLHLLKRHGKSIEPYRGGMEFRISDNPYLTERVLQIYADIESEGEFLALIQSKIGQKNVQALHAMRALVSFWEKHGSGYPQIDRVRSVFWEGIESGFTPVISASLPLISDEDFLMDSEFSRLIAVAEMPDVSENLQYYKNLSGAVTSRFKPQAASFIENLVEYGYRQLNDHLRGLGWDIPDVKDKKPAPFTEPDWNLLYESGTRPYWILETNRGRIEVEMNPLAAPATVSSIIKLSMAGLYDDLPFHRVVPNFVIQGGDVSDGTGVGGPGYLVPIEPSVKSFNRGMAGIASSGPDTEGSQFFFMNQWSPHLDGRYTLFGEVVNGMEVVDRIRMGDRVVSAAIIFER